MYSIGEVSNMFNLSISTLRYYDKQGLFMDIQRDTSGIRKFNDKTIEALRVIECLKKSGMQIKDIKQFMVWCSMGNETFKIRKDMFLKQKENVENEIKALEKTLDIIKFICWYYDEAIKDNSEERVRNIKPKDMPKEIRKAYENTHK